VLFLESLKLRILSLHLRCPYLRIRCWPSDHLEANRVLVREQLLKKKKHGRRRTRVVEPVVVAGEGVHALGGFAGQLVDLALMFSAARSAVMVHSDRAGQAAKGSLRSTSASPCCSTAFGVSRVSLLRGFVFAVIDRGKLHARSASVGLRSGPPGPGRPLPLMTKAPTLTTNIRGPKIYKPRNPEGPRICCCFAR